MEFYTGIYTSFKEISVFCIDFLFMKTGNFWAKMMPWHLKFEWMSCDTSPSPLKFLSQVLWSCKIYKKSIAQDQKKMIRNQSILIHWSLIWITLWEYFLTQIVDDFSFIFVDTALRFVPAIKNFKYHWESFWELDMDLILKKFSNNWHEFDIKRHLRPYYFY